MMNGNLEQVFMVILKVRNQFKYKFMNFWYVLSFKQNIGINVSEQKYGLIQVVVIFILESLVCCWIGLDR